MLRKHIGKVITKEFVANNLLVGDDRRRSSCRFDEGHFPNCGAACKRSDANALLSVCQFESHADAALRQQPHSVAFVALMTDHFAGRKFAPRQYLADTFEIGL